MLLQRELTGAHMQAAVLRDESRFNVRHLLMAAKDAALAAIRVGLARKAGPERAGHGGKRLEFNAEAGQLSLIHILGRTGSSKDWERLVRGVIREFEKNNSGRDLFHCDSDEDVFGVYSQYIDDLMMLAKLIRAACADEKTMGMYLNMSEAEKT